MLLQVHHIYDMINISNLLVFVLYKKNWMNIDVFFPSMNYMIWIVVASFKAMSECKLYVLLLLLSIFAVRKDAGAPKNGQKWPKIGWGG
jgi:hypothetical protein